MGQAQEARETAVSRPPALGTPKTTQKTRRGLPEMKPRRQTARQSLEAILEATQAKTDTGRAAACPEVSRKTGPSPNPARPLVCRR